MHTVAVHSPGLSVVVCTYNPDRVRLARTFAALAAQTLPAEQFEIILVDNASNPPVADPRNMPNLRIVREARQGLTFARLSGVTEAGSPIVVFVDDDNVLAENYLEKVLDRFEADKELGAIGGRITPIWENGPPPAWIEPFRDLLALRDLGEVPLRATATDPLSYPECAPVGAGMALRRAALSNWIAAVSDGNGTADRTGGSLLSGGDNDIVLHVLRSGWAVAYEPAMAMAHIIPPGRLSRDYLGRLAQDIMMSWLETLDRHGIRPWHPSTPWATRLRLLRLYVASRPWLSEAHYVRWRQRRGLILGRANLSWVGSVDAPLANRALPPSP